MKPLPDILPVRIGRFFKTLWSMSQYGHFHSTVSGTPMTKEGEPIPWFTYPAIAFLNERCDLNKAKVFEWGSGSSTRFFEYVGASIISFEHDTEWYLKVKKTLKKLGSRTHLHLRTSIEEYILGITEYSGQYDVIVIDGLVHHPDDKNKSVRLECSNIALEYLRPTGMLILDNADFLPATRRLLRSRGLYEIPFIGHTPLVHYITQTSIFLKDIKALEIFRSEYQFTPVGSIHKNYEKGYFSDEEDQWFEPRSRVL